MALVAVGSTGSFQLIISIGVGNVASPTVLPEYSVLFYTGEPLVPIFVEGKEVGKTDALGYLLVRFEKPGNYVAWVGLSSWELTYGRVYFTVERTPKVIVLMPTVNGRLVVFSNVYPVYIYLRDGRLIGVAESDKTPVTIPQGNYDLVFSVPGYEQVFLNLSVAPREEKPVWVRFAELELNAEVRVEPEKFSPNGDWYEDEAVVKIYSTKPATATLQIQDVSGKIVYSAKLTLRSGVNHLTWNGQGAPDGDYTVYVSVTDGKSTLERSARVTIDRSVYTYRKEIALATLLAFFGLMAYLVFTGVQAR